MLRRDGVAVLLQTLVLLGVYLWLESFVFGTKLNRARYGDPSILWASLANSDLRSLYLVSFVVPLLRRRDTSWSSLKPPSLRVVFTVIAVLLAVAFGSYDYNHYYDSWHAFDRAALLGLGALVWVHPGFGGPMIVLCVAMARQFETIGAYSWTDKRVVFQVFIVFVAFTSLRALWRRRTRVTPLLVLTFSILGAGYVEPAIGKWKMSWHVRDELYNLFVVSHLNHWWGTVDDSTILWWASVLAALNTVLLGATLLIEFSPLLLFLSRRLAIWIFGGCVLLHMGIFLSSGIFFWKWLVTDLVFAWMLWGMKKSEAKKHFGLRNIALWMSIPLMIYGKQLFKPTTLWWYDTEMSTSYELEAVTVSGKVYPLSRSFFSPYDMVFAQNRFVYLCKDKIIHMTYGTTQSWRLAKAIDAARTKADILALQRRYGKRRYSRRRAKRFNAFMRRFFRSVNKRGKKGFIGPIGAPHHIWSFDIPNDYRGQEPVKRVRVRLKQDFYTGSAILPIQSKLIHSVDIPSH